MSSLNDIERAIAGLNLTIKAETDERILDDSYTALGKATQVKWQDKEEFTVAFALPRELTRFQVAIRKLAGDDVVLAGAVDLARKRESTTRR